jgi:ribose-phosphate pyrophosphokinase
MNGTYADISLISGNSNLPLSLEISEYLDIPLCSTEIKKFADGEISVKINDSIRGSDVYVIQSSCPPVNDSLMEILIITDALKRASAGRINLVIPYYGYARQDRKDKPRVPISSKLIAGLLESAGADRVLALDLHAAQIQGFFDIPVDHLFATPVMIEYFRNLALGHLTVVSPDAGGVERARAFAKRLKAPLAIIDKRRERMNEADVMHIIDRVKGRDCLIVDDLIDTAGTLVKGAAALLDHGAASVRACATHAVLSGPAVERIAESKIREVVFTNSIPLARKALRPKKIRSLSVAPLLARAIRSIHEETSVSTLFV